MIAPRRWAAVLSPVICDAVEAALQGLVESDNHLTLAQYRYCWRMPYAPMGSVISLLNADRRVRASGVLASQAPSRMRFMAAAVSTC